MADIGPQANGLRPKPGRKPLPPEDATDRRRVQNRLAQRNFRDKRQQRLSETLQQLEHNKQEYQQEITDLTRKHGEEKSALEEQIKQSRAELRAARKKISELGA